MAVTNSNDVFRILVEEPDTSWLHGLVAFAVFEERRIEWMRHFVEQNGNEPTQADIDNWYQNQPDGAGSRAKADAEVSLQIYAQEVEEEILGSERSAIEKEVVVSEVRALRKPWADFGISVAGGLCSAFLFAAFLAVLAFVVFTDYSPVTFGKLVSSENRTTENGEKTDEQRSD